MANSNLSILTLNVQGLRSELNRTTLFSWLNCVKADIICLQETHSISCEEFDSWIRLESEHGNNLQNYSVVSLPGSHRSSGVAILYKSSVKLVHSVIDNAGRLVIGHFSVSSSESSSFQVACVYGPDRKQPGEEFFSYVLSQLDPSFPTILGGDFNTVVNPNIDRFGCNVDSYWAYNWPQSLSLLTSELNLVDAWRKRHPTTRDYTWRRPNGSQASRLDMFWITSTLLGMVDQVDILPFFRSDHSYVYMTFKLPSMPTRGPGVWKLNASLLKEENYVSMIRDFWSEWQNEKASFPSLAVWWDAGKIRIRSMSCPWSCLYQRERDKTPY
jgi:exonuclease III